jgi:uncharacterized protein YwgA
MAHAIDKAEPIRVENSLDLLMVLLYAPGSSGTAGEPIGGITRLQKLVFLLKEGEGPAAIVASAKEFLYKPFRMGPFSQEIYRDLDVLNSLGMLRTRRLEYLITDDDDPDPEDAVYDVTPQERVVESTQFELSELGKRVGRDLLESLTPRDREGLVQFKKFFNAIPLRQLLIFVYQKYPQYTTESQILGKLGL